MKKEIKILRDPRRKKAKLFIANKLGHCTVLLTTETEGSRGILFL